jgi:hypothetical protein
MYCRLEIIIIFRTVKLSNANHSLPQLLTGDLADNNSALSQCKSEQAEAKAQMNRASAEQAAATKQIASLEEEHRENEDTYV